MTYTQCKLRRGNVFQTAWIPSLFAKENLYIKIKEEDGWQVVSCGGTLPADYVKARSRDYRTAFPSLVR